MALNLDPVNYALGNAPDIYGAGFAGVQQGQTIQGGIDQRNVALQAQQDARTARIAAEQRQLILKQKLSGLANKKGATGTDYAALMTEYPELSENIKRAWDVLDSTQQKTELNHVNSIFYALKTGNKDVAKQLLQSEADAKRNAGMEEDAKGAEEMIKVVDDDIETAITRVGARLGAAPGAEKLAQAQKSLGDESRAQSKEARDQELAPAELLKKQADAKTAEITAKNAQEISDLGISKAKFDMAIAKENARINAMNAAFNRENNTLKKEELGLRIEEAKTKRQDIVTAKIEKLKTATAATTDLLYIVDRMLASPGLDSAVGPIVSLFPSIAGETNNFLADLDTLKAKIFLENAEQLRGLGALSETEGPKLVASMRGLNPNQSAAKFRTNLKEIKDLAERGALEAKRQISIDAGGKGFMGHADG